MNTEIIPIKPKNFTVEKKTIASDKEDKFRPVIKGWSGSLVLCKIVVPDNTVINPQSSDAILLIL